MKKTIYAIAALAALTLTVFGTPESLKKQLDEVADGMPYAGWCRDGWDEALPQRVQENSELVSKVAEWALTNPKAFYELYLDDWCGPRDMVRYKVEMLDKTPLSDVQDAAIRESDGIRDKYERDTDKYAEFKAAGFKVEGVPLNPWLVLNMAARAKDYKQIMAVSDADLAKFSLEGILPLLNTALIGAPLLDKYDAYTELLERIKPHEDDPRNAERMPKLRAAERDTARDIATRRSLGLEL